MYLVNKIREHIIEFFLITRQRRVRLCMGAHTNRSLEFFQADTLDELLRSAVRGKRIEKSTFSAPPRSIGFF